MFRISRKAVMVIFGILALAFAAGAILLFTPQGQGKTKGKTEIIVNGKPVYEVDVARIRANDPILGSNPEGVLKGVAEAGLTERLILYYSLLQDSSRVRVTSSEVRKQLDQIRERLGLTDRKAYNDFLLSQGLTDAQVRSELRGQLQIQKRIDQVEGGAKPSDQELKTFFELNQQEYRNDERIVARQIVVDDKKLAQDLYNQAVSGADFAELAKKNSKVGAEQSGALGAAAGKSDPTPVTAIVFPDPVATAAFKLKNGGITQPVEAGGRFYLVKVEKYLPAGESSFEEVKDRVLEDTKKAKGQGALEAYIEQLRAKAKVKIPADSSLKLDNPVVAKVGDVEIKLGELAQAVLSNQQLGQLMQQGLGELAVQFFMPQALDRMIDREILLAEAKKSGQSFVGPKDLIASFVQQWHTKDVKIDEAEAKKYYQDNLVRFTEQASARVTGGTFKDEAKAKAFRAEALKGGKVEDLVKKFAGELNDYGVVNPGVLPPVPNRLVFLTKGGFPKGPLGEVSEVVKLETGGFQVLVVNNRVAEQIKNYADVAEQARQEALQQKRSRVAQEWVAGLRKLAKVENKLAEVLKTFEPPKTEEKKDQPAGKITPPDPTTKPGTPKP